MGKTKGDRLFKGCRQFVDALVGPETGKTVMENAHRRYAELLEENKEEPKAMDPHTKARIYPAIAVFESLLDAGCSREEAAKVIYDFYDLFARKGGKILQTLLKAPGLYKKIPKVACGMIDKSFGADAGFTSVQRKVDQNGMHIDMLVCPYNDICRKYGCPEIIPAFCHSDDMAYGHMHPKLIWARTQTLGRGGDCCDFIIRVKH